MEQVLDSKHAPSHHPFHSLIILRASGSELGYLSRSAPELLGMSRSISSSTALARFKSVVSSENCSVCWWCTGTSTDRAYAVNVGPASKIFQKTVRRPDETSGTANTRTTRGLLVSPLRMTVLASRPWTPQSRARQLEKLETQRRQPAPWCVAKFGLRHFKKKKKRARKSEHTKKGTSCTCSTCRCRSAWDLARDLGHSKDVARHHAKPVTVLTSTASATGPTACERMAMRHQWTRSSRPHQGHSTQK